MSKSDGQTKLTAERLARQAVLYLRQSSEKQVERNKETQALQYGLFERAKKLGFVVGGQIRKRQGPPIEAQQARVFLPDYHEGTW